MENKVTKSERKLKKATEYISKLKEDIKELGKVEVTKPLTIDDIIHISTSLHVIYEDF